MNAYTDGSCLKNPGEGGWATVILNNNEVEYLVYGGEDFTSNNRMELKAVIETLKLHNTTDLITIHTDSMYVIKCANGEFKRKKNIDLWEEYDKVSYNKNIKYIWVKGHNGNKFNEIVDDIARSKAMIIKNKKILETNK